MRRKHTRLAALRAQGFDQSAHVPFTTQYRVQCSQCVATVINNMPRHEHNCPNTVHECKGCNAHVGRRGAYCEDCQ